MEFASVVSSSTRFGVASAQVAQVAGWWAEAGDGEAEMVVALAAAVC